MGEGKRFHLVGLPHTQTTAEWSNCAFTANVIGFAKMMKSLGHTVILYASEENDAPVDELVTCISRREQARIIDVHGPDTILNAQFDGSLEQWQLMNARVVEGIRERWQDGDIICTIGGDANGAIARELPELPVVEFAIGMSGMMFDENVYHIFASYSWMHTLYGRYYGAHAVQRRPYDRVIPHYLDPVDFEYRTDKEDYFLFVGRLNEDKGINIAIETARLMGTRLVVAGQGMDMPDDVNYRGRIGPAERAELMAGARAVFVPTLYLEPFGMVAIEALVSGTPIITTDFGGLAETNIDGVTGFKCRTPSDFLAAARKIGQIDPAACRARGMRYALDTVRHEYDRYFDDLSRYLRDGWHALHVEEVSA